MLKMIEIFRVLCNVFYLVSSIILFYLVTELLYKLTVVIFNEKNKIKVFFDTLANFRKKLNKKKLIIEKNNFNIYIFSKINEGSFGKIFKGIIIDEKNKNELVAIKIFEKCNENVFKDELKIYQLPNFKHENILKFIKAEVHGYNFWIVTKYQENGSLSDFLKKNMLSWTELIQICLNITEGISFLHYYSKKIHIAHRDIKPENILLDGNLKACIADFGLALFDLNKKTSLSQLGTLRYVSPEILKGTIEKSIFSLLKADIYSCALVFWEILTRYDKLDNNSNRIYLRSYEKELGENFNLINLSSLVCEKQFRPKIEIFWKKNKKIDYFCKIIDDCWHCDPKHRLSIKFIYKSLDKIKSM